MWMKYFVEGGWGLHVKAGLGRPTKRVHKRRVGVVGRCGVESKSPTGFISTQWVGTEDSGQRSE